MRILGIDGSLNHSGWVVLDDYGGDGMGGVGALCYGSISSRPTMPLGFKLLHIKKEFTNIIKSYHPDIVVIEDTYSGKNQLTTARLNNAKGVIFCLTFELLKADPICVSATTARSCLGFKNTKEDPYEFFKNLYHLKESFEKGNDITDAFTIGWWYILSQRGACVKKIRKTKVAKIAKTKK